MYRLLFAVFFACMTILAAPVSIFAQYETKDHSLLPEITVRKSAIESPLPMYPAEAVERNISGVVQIRIEISTEGEILRIKVKPRTNPVLTQAVADAVRQWRFEPWIGPGEVAWPVISRLAFRFDIIDGEGRVAMYDAQLSETLCLGCSHSALELRQWREWPEVPLKKADRKRNTSSPPLYESRQ